MAGTIKELAYASNPIVTANGVTTAVASGACVAANGTANLTNSSALCRKATARLIMTPSAAPSEGTTVALYLVPIADGSNTATVDTSTPYISPNYFVGNFYWSAASGTTQEYMDILGIDLEAYDYAPYIINNLGQSFKVSGATWTLEFILTEDQYT